MAYDPFSLETGLLGNVDIIVRDATFTNRLDAFDPTKLELHLTVLVEGDDGGEQVIFLGCGDGWETNDSGATANREDGKERNFHQSCKLGELFHGLVAVMATDAVCDKAMRARVGEMPLGPRDTAFWKGLKLHVAREERKGGGEISDYQVLVVDGFNGIEGGAKAGGAKKAAGGVKKAAKKPASDADGGLTPALLTTLGDIADASADHDSFMERAFAEVPEASSDAKVKAAVADEDGTIWQEALARYTAAVAAGEIEA